MYILLINIIPCSLHSHPRPRRLEALRQSPGGGPGPGDGRYGRLGFHGNWDD